MDDSKVKEWSSSISNKNKKIYATGLIARKLQKLKDLRNRANTAELEIKDLCLTNNIEVDFEKLRILK